MARVRQNCASTSTKEEQSVPRVENGKTAEANEKTHNQRPPQIPVPQHGIV